MKNLKSRRGFSLVELMVVVAIMGTLAAIAIPAYNEYRKSAKKTSYKTDLLSLHKGWLAFGVELDSFCRRETEPSIATLSSVGMSSLINSSLYGVTTTTAVAARCDDAGTPTCSAAPNAGTPTPTPIGCDINKPGDCTGCTCRAGAGGTAFTAHVPVRTGPGKNNLIGFSNTACSGVTAQQYRHFIHKTSTDNDCSLDISDYKMGVFGHIAGTAYIGYQVQHTGVVDERTETNATGVATTCS